MKETSMTKPHVLSEKSIANAAGISKLSHALVLENFRNALQLFKDCEGRFPSQTSDSAEQTDAAEHRMPFLKSCLKLRIRDWWIFQEEGDTYLDIFLDKGIAAEVHHPNGCQSNTQITLDECSGFHHFLLETTALDPFTDSVHVRIGSPGGEPTLREASDYLPWKKCIVELQTWTKQDSRDRYVMLLEDVQANGQSVAFSALLSDEKLSQGAEVVLKEGSRTFLIPLAEVKIAQALPFHNETLLFAKKGQKNKNKKKLVSELC